MQKNKNRETKQSTSLFVCFFSSEIILKIECAQGLKTDHLFYVALLSNEGPYGPRDRYYGAGPGWPAGWVGFWDV